MSYPGDDRPYAKLLVKKSPIAELLATPLYGEKAAKASYAAKYQKTTLSPKGPAQRLRERQLAEINNILREKKLREKKSVGKLDSSWKPKIWMNYSPPSPISSPITVTSFTSFAPLVPVEFRNIELPKPERERKPQGNMTGPVIERPRKLRLIGEE